jgi:hypothetical protein
MDSAKPTWGWADYDDIGHVLELTVVFDDALKKNPKFLVYAVKLANRICEDLGIKASVTWGKRGGRLEYDFNPTLTSAEMEAIAIRISNHKSWKALMESTRVFTYGHSWEDDPEK